MNRKREVLFAHMQAAEAYSKLSYAKRLKVGALIVKEDRVISTGRNGTPVGRDNTCEETLEDSISFTKLEVVHAEANAILFAARNGTSIDGCDLIITHSPCFECAKMIVQSGIKNVYYREKYRDLSPVEFLKECNINVERI